MKVVILLLALFSTWSAFAQAGTPLHTSDSAAHFCRCLKTGGRDTLLIRVDIQGGQKMETELEQFVDISYCNARMIDHPACK